MKKEKCKVHILTEGRSHRSADSKKLIARSRLDAMLIIVGTLEILLPTEAGPATC